MFCRKAEMEAKRKKEEEARKKQEEKDRKAAVSDSCSLAALLCVGVCGCKLVIGACWPVGHSQLGEILCVRLVSCTCI